MNSGSYIGKELELFQHATNWKQVLQKQLAPYLIGDVLEVGAGLGANTAIFFDPSKVSSWTALEPDAAMCEEIRAKVIQAKLPMGTIVHYGTVVDIPDAILFDAIIYIDVLEHIEDDRGELSRAFLHLKPNGKVVVLSPAWNYLFSEFDRSIGHFRRYDKDMLTQIKPQHSVILTMRYLDSIGYFASIANKLLLHQNLPTLKQILFWDRVLVRLSKFFDPLLFFRFGKSILAVYSKT